MLLATLPPSATGHVGLSRKLFVLSMLDILIGPIDDVTRFDGSMDDVTRFDGSMDEVTRFDGSMDDLNCFDGSAVVDETFVDAEQSADVTT